MYLCPLFSIATLPHFIYRFVGVVLGVGLAGSIGSMLGVFATSPEQTVSKHVFWLVSFLLSSVVTLTS
jgi:hypothetical protein